MKAFNNDIKTKELFVNRMKTHHDADEIIQGETWENGKGCFIGCSFHNYKHEKFNDIGLPTWLAHLADKIFEGLSKEDAKIFARDFYSKINIGANLDEIKIPFLTIVCKSVLEYVQKPEHLKQKQAIECVILELEKPVINSVALKVTKHAAHDAAYAAYTADTYTTYAAYTTATYATYAAHAAAYAATYAAYITAYVYAVAAAIDPATYTAKHEKYKYFADKLFELMELTKDKK